jgi:hypothetical protein
MIDFIAAVLVFALAIGSIESWLTERAEERALQQLSKQPE